MLGGGVMANEPGGRKVAARRDTLTGPASPAAWRPGWPGWNKTKRQGHRGRDRRDTCSSRGRCTQGPFSPLAAPTDGASSTAPKPPDVTRLTADYSVLPETYADTGSRLRPVAPPPPPVAAAAATAYWP